MKVIGVTGGIGMGKSACAELLRGLGVPVIDTDDLARELVKPGHAALQEISETFGKELIDSTGALIREELAARVFSSEPNRLALEAILHPRIRVAWLEAVRRWKEQGRELASVIIPLLFETRAEADLDAVICVACSERTQFERLAPRGWTPDQIARRSAAQLAVSEKIARSNYVIWSEGSLALHQEQLKRILKLINPALDLKGATSKVQAAV